MSLIIAVLALGAGAWVAVPRIKTAYTARKVERSLEQARAFLAQDDLAQASLAMKVALASGRQQVEVWRVAAEFAERTNPGDAVHLRRRILTAVPDSLSDRLALAQAALAARDYRTAHETLTGASQEQKESPRYKQIVIAYALATQQLPLADALLTELATEDADASVRLLHATVLIRHPRAEKSAAARATLTEMAKDAALRLAALRALVQDAFARRDQAEAMRLASELAASPGATLADQLAELNSVLFAGGKIEPAQFAAVQERAAKNPADAIAYVQWLLVQQRAEAAREWIMTLPAEQRATPGFAYAETEIAAALQQWDRLGELLRAGVWGPLSADTVRLAFSAHSVHEATPGALADGLWNETLAVAGTNLFSQRALLRLAGLWRWEHASRSTLFAIVREHPNETWAYESLVRGLQAARATAALRDALVLWRNADPNSARLQHDAALLTLLLEAPAGPNGTTETLKRLHESEPDNPIFATGHAFALWRLGRPAEAVAVVDRLSPAERDLPARAPYLAAIYAGAGRTAEAQAALGRVVSASLLPEEAGLVAQASASAL